MNSFDQMAATLEKILGVLEEIRDGRSVAAEDAAKASPRTRSREFLELASLIMIRARESWEKREPIELSEIGRAYGKRAKTFGGVEFIFKHLVETKELAMIMKISGGRCYIPHFALNELTSQDMERLTTHGLSENRALYYKEKQLKAHSITNPDSEEPLTDEELQMIEEENARAVAKLRAATEKTFNAPSATDPNEGESV